MGATITAMMEALEKNNHLRWTFVVLLAVWLGGVLLVSGHHELWKDEVRAWTIALSAPHPGMLPDLLKNEGHPIIWYLLLWIGGQITHSPLVINILNVAVAFSAITLFVSFSPFRPWFKVLFIFTFLPFYEYSVMARNYGISMLFLFLFAALYCSNKGKEKRCLLALSLMLAANTNIHSTMLVCLLCVRWFWDEWTSGRGGRLKFGMGWTNIWPFMLVGLAVIFALITVLPDQDSAVFNAGSLDAAGVLNALWQAILHPGYHFDELFIGMPGVLRDCIILVLVAGLFSYPLSAALAFFGAVVLGGFFSVFYQGSLRHEGIYFVFVIVLYWLALANQKIAETDVKISRSAWVRRIVLVAVIPLLFLIQIAGSARYIYRDITQQMSSSAEFGEFLHISAQFSDAIIIGEPDIRLESLPYYANNEIYLPREGKYKKYVSLTVANKNDLSLSELIDCARKISRERKKEVLIVLGHFGLADQNPPFIRTEQYGKVFSWTQEGLLEFVNSTEKISEFKSDVKNERYEVYRFKPDTNISTSG